MRYPDPVAQSLGCQLITEVLKAQLKGAPVEEEELAIFHAAVEVSAKSNLLSAETGQRDRDIA